jgi:hypothetical protein
MMVVTEQVAPGVSGTVLILKSVTGTRSLAQPAGNTA